MVLISLCDIALLYGFVMFFYLKIIASAQAGSALLALSITLNQLTVDVEAVLPTRIFIKGKQC
jgi:hypothetical protein